eukprot:CAMPEP_0179186414 /NCGR_PEP_ID=MMETSP0796-20121207/92458_1 /TAXON_ID=73915 /ORGANISM="Pyrodinium bahamense, Strain pbaha01" /LENGTH=240 /DNA_ID=CAMNT_0020890405 /DNA_START=8 /DNA_END=730 /DNA_ORIENTATION=-
MSRGARRALSGKGMGVPVTPAGKGKGKAREEVREAVAKARQPLDAVAPLARRSELDARASMASRPATRRRSWNHAPWAASTGSPGCIWPVHRRPHSIPVAAPARAQAADRGAKRGPTGPGCLLRLSGACLAGHRFEPVRGPLSLDCLLWLSGACLAGHQWSERIRLHAGAEPGCLLSLDMPALRIRLGEGVRGLLDGVPIAHGTDRTLLLEGPFPLQFVAVWYVGHALPTISGAIASGMV